MEQIGVQIMTATAADLPAIAELAGMIWRAHYPGIISDGQIEYMLGRMYDPDVMKREIEGGTCYDCLRLSKQLVGFACYGPLERTEIKLHKLYVHPEWQRHGLGSRLLRHVETAATAQQATSLYLTVNKANSKAIAAYQKNGFSIREATVVDIGGGFVMDDYVMAKAL